MLTGTITNLVRSANFLPAKNFTAGNIKCSLKKPTKLIGRYII